MERGDLIVKLEEFIKLQELERNKNKKKRRTTPKKFNTEQRINMELTRLWNSNSEDEWDEALKKYWDLVKPENVILEEAMEKLNPDEVKNLTAEGFYNFLHDVYFVWKYTAKNRLATTRMHLKRYQTENRLSDLDKIKKKLFSFELGDTQQGLEIASSIHGLGIAGASGLLALLFPRDFGTVDQFVVKDLISIEDINQREMLQSMNPEGLKLMDGVELIEIMKDRANELNRINNTNKWTPRHIDKVLWAYRI